MISVARTRVLLALIRVYQRDGRATVRRVAYEARRPVYATHLHLVTLRAEGLVAWTDGQEGTLRPLYQPVLVLDGAT